MRSGPPSALPGGRGAGPRRLEGDAELEAAGLEGGGRPPGRACRAGGDCGEVGDPGGEAGGGGEKPRGALPSASTQRTACKKQLQSGYPARKKDDKLDGCDVAEEIAL